MKKILIPNGSFHDIPIIKKAKENGYYVITSGADPNGIGHKYADEYVYADFSDKEKMLTIAQEKGIDRICSNCNDFGYLSACYVAEKLKLGGHELYSNAEILHQKDKFKKLAEKLNLNTPIAHSLCDEKDACNYVKDIVYPIIVKPVDLGAGQGISRADTYDQALVAIHYAFEKSKSKRIVVEPFIEGTSHSFNAFIVNQKVCAYYSDNEYMNFSNYRVSTSAGPADDIDQVSKILISNSEIIAKELELTDGLLHSQYIKDKNDQVHIIEITRRMSGDWYPYPEMKATNIDWVDYLVKAQCGESVKDFPKNVIQKNFTGRHCLNGTKKGKVKGVKFKAELEKYIYDNVFWFEEGYYINNLEKDYPGIIFFEFDDRDKMNYIVSNIKDYVELEYE